VTGTEGDRVKAGVSVADIAAGMYAFSGILAALLERQRTGLGRRLDVSMLESLTEWMGFPLYYAFDGAPPPPRSGASHSSIYPYGPFPAGDGKSVIFGLQNEREWIVFCERVLQRPELATDERFSSNARRNEARAELYRIIVDTFAPTDAQALRRRLDDAGIANARVNELDEVWHHPQLSARRRWRDVGSPAGPIAALVPPGLSPDEDVPMGDIPALGAHTESILRGLGYDSASIARLRATNTV
jgi:crotonobetainyl-CoA:carnitine CoA-transferase CaiB-like acyl-CoA transferase